MILNDIYLFIDQLGLNTTKIYAAIGAFSFLLVFAIREIFAWFMKTSAISKQFVKISNRLESIEAKLDQISQPSEYVAETTPSASQNKKLFEINH